MQPASSLDARWPDLIAAVSTVIDLDATARTSRALIRRRGIRSAAMLLRLALAYGPGGLSLRAAAAWAGASGLADLSDTAVMNRLRQAADWLGEIAGALLRRAAAAPAAAGPLPGRRLRIADGSMVARAGGRGSGWRLHATYDPVAGRLTGLEVTDDRGAEGFGRTAWRAGDVALGERCYARPPALRQILAAGADVIVRTGWARLRLLDADGAPMAWEPVFESLAPGEVADRTVAVDYSGQGRRSRGKATFPARLIVLRLPPEAAERATAAVRRKHRRHYARHQLLPLTIQSAGYLMLLTSLPPTVPASEVLAAYRLRWQVELAFKRLKSLLGLDRLPAKGEALARSWLLAHLILALLIEDAAQDLLAVPPSAARDLRTPPSRLALARRAGAARCMPDRRSRPTGRRRAARHTCPALQAPPRAAASANMPAHAGKRPRGCF
jgi:Transposase DDE domain